MDPLPSHVYEGPPTREAIRILILYPAIDFQAPLEAHFYHGRIPSLAITANRRLWIDAICINQADAEEKTLQVPLMRSIYTATLKVHAWLGVGGTFDAQAVFTHLKRIVVVDELEKETISLPNQFRKDCAATQSTLQQLFLNPWFTRRWVLQEIALAHEITVHYGYDKISWNWFPYKVAKKTIETSLKPSSGTISGFSDLFANMS
ncbi:hypothetical protein COCCADRAFT_37857 [Bipolaris zeicola 26-R-13]|uniref:Heterokaryon incompatibility domain-containing protein n=1 Tax=Cochliobolus carbonum (strain 26-R-13) TaxID=930089 RepID=W6Y9V1_COCC2|nr:uncharacterized protein COCCADRAFT_37857 [Bipolaris zeicola 26-R-13]EUC32189.1 hypothetical protein COCCADRAFT_37857 [Bipolaris zeicola 26-R-13]